MSLLNSPAGLLGAAVVALAMMPGAARAETPLNMAVVSRTVFYLPAWMAEKQGFFKAEGLDVRMRCAKCARSTCRD
jgi:ABC-type nitrate/sulfonate/bicarbonate transport system substrate-binding protein